MEVIEILVMENVDADGNVKGRFQRLVIWQGRHGTWAAHVGLGEEDWHAAIGRGRSLGTWSTRTAALLGAFIADGVEIIR